MPRIIVEAVRGDTPEATVTLQERLVPVQLESDWFSSQLIERVCWAVQDAAAVERQAMGD